MNAIYLIAIGHFANFEQIIMQVQRLLLLLIFFKKIFFKDFILKKHLDAIVVLL